MNWIISANNAIFDYDSAFANLEYIFWRQNRNFEAGDIVYIYAGKPDQKVKFKTVVQEVNLPYSKEMNNDNIYFKKKDEIETQYTRTFMKLKRIVSIDSELLNLEHLHANGLNGRVQGGMRISDELCKYIESILNRNEYTLHDYYKNYLRVVRGLKDSSINHYMGGLSTISKILSESGKIQDSIFEVADLKELQSIKTYLKNNPSFIKKDSTGHNMYSAALNNYYKFAEGDDFFTVKYDFKQIDIPIEVAERKKIYKDNYVRSSIIKNQSIKSAKYLCELNYSHHTFTAKSNLKQYMEGHHLIPFENQSEFKYSLDVYANIVCLCPICHRLLHYGIEQEKRACLESLFIERKERLEKSGISISQNDFLELTM